MTDKDAAQIADRALAQDSARHQLVNCIFQNLLRSSHEVFDDLSTVASPWTLYVREDSRPFARCYPGRRVVISTALMNFVETTSHDLLFGTDDVIASLLAHEMAHGIANHAAEEKAVLVTSGCIAAAIAAAASAALRSPTILSPLVGWFLFLQYQSRIREREADEAGMRILAAAGYDVDATEAWWRLRPSKTLRRRNPKSDGAATASVSSAPGSAAAGEARPCFLHRMSAAVETALGLLSAHPRDAERADAAAALARRLKARPSEA